MFSLQEQQANIQPYGPTSNLPTYTPTPSAPELLDHVIYPNDFPAGPSKTNLPSSGLLLPDASKGAIPKYVF